MKPKTDPEIQSAVKSGYLWSLLNVAFSQIVSLTIFVVMSHMLAPSVFGIFALAAVVVDLISEQGRWAASDAIVQRRAHSPLALSSAYFSLLGLCTLLAVVFSLSASHFASVTGEPDAANVLTALSLTLLLMPAIAVMDALLLGRLNYRTQSLRSMAGISFGGMAGLVVAFGPASEWALVAQRLAALGANLAVVYAFTRWRPQLLFDMTEAREFLRRTIQIWAATTLAGLHWRITQASIGIRAGASDLGQLNVALRLDAALHGPTTGPIQSLWVPVLSELRFDRARSWQLFIRLSQLTSVIALPAFVGLGLVGQDLVSVVMDERYREVGDILFVLGLQGFIIPIGFFSNLIFSGLDRSDLSLRFSLAYLSLSIPAVWMVAGHGAIWALSISLAAMGIATALATLMQVSLLGGRLRDLISALTPAYASGLVMLVVVLSAKRLLPLDAGFLRLSCLAALGAMAYIGWLTLFHRRQAMGLWQYLQSADRPLASER